MTILRLEVSNPQFTPKNTQFLTVHSSATQRRHDIQLYNVEAIKPGSPLIILMHGVYGSSWVWTHLGGVDKAYENIKQELGLHEFLLVMPSDGGLLDGSAYLPLKNHQNYESWIMQDVIDAVKTSNKNITENSNIYLCGLSMGGYGALRLGSKYANKISGISAHSAITQLSDMTNFVDDALSEYECEHQYETDIQYWMQHNYQDLPPLRFDCGINDPLITGNKALHQFLLEQKIDHTFEVFDGAHEWEYWHKHVQKSFQFFAKIESNSI